MPIWMNLVAVLVFSIGLSCWTGLLRRWFVYPQLPFLPPTFPLGFLGLGSGWLLVCIAALLPESSFRAALILIGMVGGLLTLFLFGNFWPRRWWPQWMKDVAEERERDIEAKRDGHSPESEANERDGA